MRALPMPLVALVCHAGMTGCVLDPAPGIWQSRTEARNLECTRLSQARAHELYPTEVPEPAPRGHFDKTDALACQGRFLRLDERAARDEALLSSLRESVAEIVEEASNPPGFEEVVWHVDAFYPEPRVAGKIAVAARTELAERGRRVSDRVPLLAAGDIVVLGRLPAKEAYPLACARYSTLGALRQREALLGLMLIDARETELHAGLCLEGKWRWLR
ncbi:MAG: hypothetical protein HY901_28995 [Deltaproteobacteria bacterium]|nr:hypothetical protein [Deltaproteobacteria bacterium]